MTQIKPAEPWKNFVMENENLVMEICTLDEMGYKLQPDQSDLTIIQKLFLFYGYGVYRRKQKEFMDDQRDNHDTPSQSDELKFKRKYDARLEENRMRYERMMKNKV